MLALSIGIEGQVLDRVGSVADVRVVVRTLFRKHGFEYTIAPGVQGLVDSSVLVKPFEVALFSILSQVGASYRMESGIYIISGSRPTSRLVGEYGRRQYVTIYAENERLFDVTAKVREQLWRPRYLNQSERFTRIPIDSELAYSSLILNPVINTHLNKRPVSEFNDLYLRAVPHTPANSTYDTSENLLSTFEGLNVPKLEVMNLEIRQALRRLLTPFDIRFRVAPELRGTVSVLATDRGLIDVLEAMLFQLGATYVMEGDIVIVFPAARQ